MAKTVRILAVLLGVQVLLAFGLNMSHKDISDVAPDQPLLSASLDNLDEIVIADGPQSSLTLKRQDDQWQLPSLDGFPANSDQANQLVDALVAARQGIPVATSADAQSRFKVAKDDFKRRLVLRRDGKDVATVYLGSSPGADQSYARLKGDSNIYRVKLAAYQAPVDSDSWLDKEILTTPIDKIAAIEVGDLKLTQTTDKPAGKDDGDKADKTRAPAPWHVDGLPSGKTLDTKAAATLAGQMSGLRIQSLADADAAKQALTQPNLTIKLDKQDGKSVTYTFAKAETDNTAADKTKAKAGQQPKAEPWFLSVSDQDRTFRINATLGQTLEKAASPDKLLVAAADDKQAADTASNKPANDKADDEPAE
ncbi:DUF4340 domain-containing protein [Marinobacter halodurans]|uniref:DUF4340 domain-containing protein n=1 Tax=Marinobacter halodurans TaxID=2528979 RepID=A0ABY1ZJK7_9GAMM|nr:DUF4340 domain-containing protein [Marinobacter halodurans]TBW55195.1 DUF4340 domain-containing protein [Marinobacter halodurans]